MATHICDGCGREVDPAHVRDRILRLEAATRFRPLHIATLLVAVAPPVRAADDFYWLDTAESPSEGAQFFQRQLLEAAGVKSTQGKSREAQLAEFQRQGFYVAYLWECPMPNSGGGGPASSTELDSAAKKLALRIRFSYKPKHVVLLGAELVAVAQRMAEADVAAKLLLHNGAPVPLPASNNPQKTAAFRAAMGDVLARAAVPAAPRSAAP